MKNILIVSCLLVAGFNARAQAIIDTAAIHFSDSRITHWAEACEVSRGWMNIADTSLGLAFSGNDTDAIGAVSSGSGVVSLGDAGVATLTFSQPLRNIPGPDFVVFENGFLSPVDSSLAFLELAFVEVSSDGQRFVRFPSVCNLEREDQVGGFEAVSNIPYQNFAGRYVAGFGTGFDLASLQDSVGLDINAITHVRVIDVVGSIDPLFARYDALGNVVNEPYPTPYFTGGFDLAGMGVLSEMANSIRNENKATALKLYPNPVQDKLFLTGLGSQSAQIAVYSVEGLLKKSQELNSVEGLDVSDLSAGVYYLVISHNSHKSLIKFVKH